MLEEKILIGTSGWDYEDWVGPFYSSSEKKFSTYSQIFRTVEIDSTFYSFPSPSFIRGLSRTAPRGFKFSAKLPKDITHKKLLDVRKGVLEDLSRFLEILTPLENEDKLGALLIQMPPKTREELFENFSKFLENLEVERYDFVAEFRDESWLNGEVFKLLKKFNVAYCIVDEPLLPPVIEVTGSVAYVRWHGRGNRPWYYYEYREEELKEWLPRLNRIASEVEILYGYFNNHFRGYAPKNALQMLKLLGSIDSNQERVLNQILDYFDKESVRIIKEKGREIILTRDLNAMLSLFIDRKRLERALEEKDNVKIIEHDNNTLAGTVKDYSFRINLVDKTIVHDCEDWRKRLTTKQFCKHIGGVFLYLAKDDATDILIDIITNIDGWKFQT